MDLPVDSLPHQVRELYQEYKRRQKILVTWLQQEGKVADQYDKQKYDKDGNLSIVYLERLTASVLEQKVIIPDDIMYSARTMLNMRKEVSLHYRDAEEGHERCIALFEQIVASLNLLPRVPASPPQERIKNPDLPVRLAAMNAFAALPHIRMPGLGPNYIHSQSASLTSVKTTKRLDVKADSSLLSKKQQRLSDDAELETGALMHALLLNMETVHFQGDRILCKVRQGSIPLHIAAYVIERAFLMIFGFSIKLWSIVFGDDVTDMGVEEVKMNIRNTLDRVQQAGKFDSAKDVPGYDLEQDLIAPYEQLIIFQSSSGPSSCLSELGSQVRAKQTSLKDQAVQASREDSQNAPKYATASEYYKQLLQDLKWNSAVDMLSADDQLVLATSSRFVDLFSIVLPSRSATLPAKMFWASSMNLLWESTQSFEKPIDEEGRVISPRKILPIVNCRQKVLSLAREVLDTLETIASKMDKHSAGFSTKQNIHLVKNRLAATLVDKRFDLVTENPAIAGSEVMLILDLAYQFGMQLFAFRDMFTGVLHVYNALCSLQLLDKISILDTLCEKFLDAVFYNTRPNKRFARAWEFASDSFNYAEANKREAKETLSMRGMDPLHLPYSSKSLQAPETVRTERCQYLYENSKLCYNKRLQASKHSLTHRIFNQKDDTQAPFSEETIHEVLDSKTVKLLFADPRSFDRSHEVIDDLVDEGWVDAPHLMLTKLEEALMKEFSEPFPLMAANLIKVWQHCHAVMNKMLAKEGRDMLLGCRPCFREVLRQCDEIVSENNRMKKEDLGTEQYVKERTKKYKQVRRWRRALTKEFDGLTMSDFLWKNV